MITLRALERLLLPNVCVACERLTGRADTLVCGLCRARLRRLAAGCTRCRQPLPPVGPCRFCAEWPSVVTQVHSAVWLEDEAREILHHLKYGGYWVLADAAAETIDRTMPRRPYGMLCPIPLARRRLRERGYNQAEMLAAALARRWGLPLLPGLLQRTRETKTQTKLDPARRKQNVTGAFSASSASGGGVVKGGDGAEGRGGRAVILVDDVLTTGATIAAAADALERAGWAEVHAVTFARALPYVRRAVAS